MHQTRLPIRGISAFVGSETRHFDSIPLGWFVVHEDDHLFRGVFGNMDF